MSEAITLLTLCEAKCQMHCKYKERSATLRRLKKIIAVILAFIVLFPYVWTTNVTATPATRARLAELEEQMQEAYDAVTEQQVLIEGVRYEMEVILQEMYELDMRLMEVMMNLEASELALLETEVRIADAEIELELATEDRDRQYDTLRSRLRVMHESGPVSWLDVLIHSESITDFLLRFEYLRTISQFDQEMFVRLDAATERVEYNMLVLNRSSVMILDLARQHEAQEAELERVLADRADWFAELAANEHTLQLLIEILQEEYYALDYEFGIVHTRFVAEEAEAERQRRIEQDAQRRADAQAREAARQTELTAVLGNFNGRFTWPLPARGPSDISSGFGPRTNPLTGHTENHAGIDIPAPAGSRINAAADGVVRFAGWSGGWGNMVIIDHGGGYSTAYAHNSRNRVSQGQQVTRGQHIADVGTTGQSTGNHLHFEIRRNNVAVNPMNYF